MKIKTVAFKKDDNRIKNIIIHNYKLQATDWKQTGSQAKKASNIKFSLSK